MAEKREGRMIHVRLPVELHKKLRMKVAEEDTTIQDWVLQLIEQKLKEIEK